ncbi:hypothetical protein [Streptomyces sp.]|uniref:hypothetical protein n=1 Tax=Streptomyces sp. TaxID=1931 RepID=UPI002F3EFB2D
MVPRSGRRHLAAGFAALFLTTLAVVFLRGIRGADAVRRADLVTFGWPNRL